MDTEDTKIIRYTLDEKTYRSLELQFNRDYDFPAGKHTISIVGWEQDFENWNIFGIFTLEN